MDWKRVASSDSFNVEYRFPHKSLISLQGQSLTKLYVCNFQNLHEN